MPTTPEAALSAAGTASAKGTMFLQRSLFPDAFEVQARALARLDRFELEEALELVAEARASDPGLANVEPLHAALLWLRRELGGERVSDELLALLFLMLPEGVSRGEITRDAAAIVDPVVARQGLARAGARAFLDPDERVHRGALLLVLRRAGEARGLLAETLVARDDRADLWAAFGDASFALERLDEANAAYVRALLLGARELDFFRLQHPRLAALHAALVEAHGEACACELLLVHAWLAGVLDVPPENGWVDRHLSRLNLAAVCRPGATREQRLRRFGLLFYLDRSRARGHYDEAQREELKDLEPELFVRLLEHVRVREKGRTGALRW